jgi:hypothetical protein
MTHGPTGRIRFVVNKPARYDGRFSTGSIRSNKATFIRRGLPLLALAVCLLITGAVWQCSRRLSRQPRIQRLRPGTTLQEVENVLGKPLTVITLPTLSGVQVRMYSGDGNHTIDIRFENGAAVDIHERVPRHNWPPVG